MKKLLSLIIVSAMICGMFSGCEKASENIAEETEAATTTTISTEDSEQNDHAETVTKISLSDDVITVNGKEVSSDTSSEVYVSNDIVYYEEGQGFKYGEGGENDAHTAEEAGKHTVVNITKPGVYSLSGKLSFGQISVNLGEDAEEDPEAVVTLILDNADITCTVAPAVIFYNVYECGTTDIQAACAVVDTTDAGANIIIADGSTNTLNGSYVAKIYKPDSVELSEDGTEVLDAKKLHKYDGTLYSKMSMNIDGGEIGDGILNINAENEGLDSELHLTVNGGVININSGNDGINTNEDNMSVTTVNGGELNIVVNGSTGEGDGIDSNGWLVINGGTVFAQACAMSGDAGIDSDRGIYINGGTVFATGNMLDTIGSDSRANFAVFTFERSQTKGEFILRNNEGMDVASKKIDNNFRYLIISSEEMLAGEYSLMKDDVKLSGVRSEAGSMGGMMGGAMPEDMTPPEGFEGGNRGERPELPEGEMVPGDGQQPPEMSESFGNDRFEGDIDSTYLGEPSVTFVIEEGGNYFVSVAEHIDNSGTNI